MEQEQAQEPLERRQQAHPATVRLGVQLREHRVTEPLERRRQERPVTVRLECRQREHLVTVRLEWEPFLTATMLPFRRVTRP